jgi:hypothetical protein
VVLVNGPGPISYTIDLNNQAAIRLTKGYGLQGPEAAFLGENPWAAQAEACARQAGNLTANDSAVPRLLATAQIAATLALAYEQRQTRFDIDAAIQNHAQQVAP